MKKIVIFSKQSLFSGNMENGIAEVVDSLAVNLTSEYQVNVVCAEGDLSLAQTVTDIKILEEGIKYGRFLQINYYIVESNHWSKKAKKIIDFIQPDIFHAFEEPEIILILNNRPRKSIFTFDSIDFLYKNLKILSQYDAVTSFSEEYVKIAERYIGDEIKKEKVKLQKVKIGVVSNLFSPEKGVLLPAPYSVDDLTNKQISRQRIKEKYDIKNDFPICLILCRLTKEKGLDNVINSISEIKNQKINLLIIGQGDKYYEQLLKEKSGDNVIFINNFGTIMQVIPLAAGVDFYLQPSLMESGGIMPMTMSLYGTIPIVTLNGGLRDNFNEDNAIVIKDNKIVEALDEAITLYSDIEALNKKQRNSMLQPFSWEVRKKRFIEIYESEE